MADDDIQSKAGRVVALEAELESAGEVSVADAALAQSRAVLHGWIDSVVAVVSSPGNGRATLIHKDGTQSSISSPVLPYLLCQPARFDTDGQEEKP